MNNQSIELSLTTIQSSVFQSGSTRAITETTWSQSVSAVETTPLIITMDPEMTDADAPKDGSNTQVHLPPD